MAKEKKEPEEEGAEIDFGVGKISFGGLFKGIGNLIDLASRLSEETAEIGKIGEIKGLGKGVKGVYGFTLRTLVGGEPVVESFGNIKETPKGPVVEEVSEPIVDLFDEGDHIRVIAELPGVEEEEIHVEIKGDILNLTAEGRERKYSKEVLLPCDVDADSMTSSCKNGVLEIGLAKKAS